MAALLLAPIPGLADEPPALFRTIEADPEPPTDGRYRESWQVTPDVEALRRPTERFRLELPGAEPEIVELLHWAPRAGYIQEYNPDDPDRPIIIPMPGAPDEAFSWRWYGKSENYTVAMTMVDGVISGRVSGAARRFGLDPRGVGENRLGEVTPGYWRQHPPPRERQSESHHWPAAPAIAATSVISPAAPTANAGVTPAVGTHPCRSSPARATRQPGSM